jgi:hypothetical protein
VAGHKPKIDAVIRDPSNNEDFMLQGAHLLGDSAYLKSLHLLPPFKDNGKLNHAERRFNKRQVGTRMAIERCFGQLKARFMVLKNVNFASLESQRKVVTACCVLHNFIKICMYMYVCIAM